MKKMVSVVLAATMMISMLTGCGSNVQKEVKEEEKQSVAVEGAEQVSDVEAEPVTLKWAVWYVDGTPYYKPLIEAYMEEHPNVTIELVDLGNTDYMTVLATQLSGGADDLDIINIKDVAGYSNLVNLGMLEPLSERAKAAGLNTEDFGGTIEQISVDGEYYTLPFINSFWLLFYNKDLFDAAGVEYPANDMTLDEYDQLARSLTSGEGASKVYGCHYQTWRNTVQLFGILDGKHTIIEGNYGWLAPYYERVLQQQKDGICMDYATLKTSSTHYTGVFYNEQTAMIHMGNWFIGMLIDSTKNGENLAENWGIVRYPHPDGVEAGTTLSTITSVSVNSKSAHKDVAFDFIKFVAGEEGAKIVAEAGLFPMIMSDEALNAIASLEGFPEDETSREALKVKKSYLEMPMTIHAADMETVLNAAHDNIMTENVTVEEGIEEMNEGIQEILNSSD